ncbi:MAG: tRNA (adenosine(37)-N6)-threonylcarbamoyltransferase complex transferase subunit TsaD, partial [Planctomycetota bacterium]
MLTQQDIYILGIETSCDETAASVVVNGTQVKSSV